jgi:transposase
LIPVASELLAAQMCRRRPWTEEQKRALLAAAFAPGATVADIARRADVRPSQIYRWRGDLRGASTGFAAVMVTPDRPVAMTAPAALIVELGGAVVRITAEAPPALASAVLRSLRR